MTGLFGYKALSEKFINNVGEIGHDEGKDQGHGQVGCLDPSLGEKVPSVCAVTRQFFLHPLWSRLK